MVATENAHLKIRINERVALLECGDLSPLSYRVVDDFLRGSEVGNTPDKSGI